VAALRRTTPGRTDQRGSPKRTSTSSTLRSHLRARGPQLERLVPAALPSQEHEGLLHLPHPRFSPARSRRYGGGWRREPAHPRQGTRDGSALPHRLTAARCDPARKKPSARASIADSLASGSSQRRRLHEQQSALPEASIGVNWFTPPMTLSPLRAEWSPKRVRESRFGRRIKRWFEILSGVAQAGTCLAHSMPGAVGHGSASARPRQWL
jgi:hypothetical protein